MLLFYSFSLVIRILELGIFLLCSNLLVFQLQNNAVTNYILCLIVAILISFCCGFFSACCFPIFFAIDAYWPFCGFGFAFAFPSFLFAARVCGFSPS